MLAKVGTFTRRTTTGDQSITGVGFRPKALIFWSNNLSVVGGTDRFYWVQGVTDGTRHLAINTVSNDAVGTSEVNRAFSETYVYFTYNAGGTVTARAVFSSFDADGFSLTYPLNDGIASLINYIAIGGDDVNAYLGQFAAPTSAPATLAVTGVGFRPTTLITFPVWDFSIGEVGDFCDHPSIGWADMVRGGGAAAAAVLPDAAVSDTRRHLTSTYPFMNLRSNESGGFGDIQRQASVASFDADGFTIDQNVRADATLRDTYFLALSGVSSFAGSLSQPTSPGSQSVSLSAPPKLVLFQSVGAVEEASPQSEAQYCLGASDGTDQRSVTVADLDNTTTTINCRFGTNTAVIQAITPAATGASSTINAQASVTAFSASGFALNWTTADATPRKVIYLALSDPITIETLPADRVRSTSARLRGRINPNNLSDITGAFAWSTDPENLTEETLEQAISVGTAFVSYSATITDLQPETAYYFRAIANSSGSSFTFGETLSFETAGEQQFIDGQVSFPLTWATLTTRDGVRHSYAEVDLNDAPGYYDGYKPHPPRIVLTGCTSPFDATPDSRHPVRDGARPLLPATRCAFADVIAARAVRLQFEYQDSWLLASQADGSLDVWESESGLMFRAELALTRDNVLLAAAIRGGYVKHCCTTGKYSRIRVDLLTGMPVAMTRVDTATINVLFDPVSRPTFPGTWVRCEACR